MNVYPATEDFKRQTAADEVFHFLRREIISLNIEPGTKISEVEVAKTCSVSRQPVREAFMRLGELDLLQIRPQKATLVKKISMQALENTRFIRAAVEVEVVRIACEVATDGAIALLWQNLEKQMQSKAMNNPLELQALDLEFHRLICEAANKEHAFRVVSENKAHTERVCTLELSDEAGMEETVAGHRDIVTAISARDSDQAVQLMRHHLAHLDSTLEKARENHPEFFET